MTDVGLIGLGVMGRNLVLNMVDHGHKVHVFNRTRSKITEIEKISPQILGFDDLESFVSSLRSPRKILIMVSAGNAVDEFLGRLKPLLCEDDIVVDCGNSDYNDTIRRGREYLFHFAGCGVSGGEYGARYGPSIMVGCKKDVYEQLKDILESISAKHDSKPCCKWLGNDGAGHFVKIVHNGIEYCEMQLLQEILNMIGSREYALKVFRKLNSGRSGGYLVEICEKIMCKRNNAGYFIDQISDKAEQKGTGKMCVLSAIEIDVDVGFIAQAVFSRYLSNSKERRQKFHEISNKQGSIPEMKLKRLDQTSEILVIIEKAFYLAKCISYIQGAKFLMKRKEFNKWEYSISDVCDVWKDGCVLRCKFLNILPEIALDDALEHSDTFIKILEECLPSLRQFCQMSIQNNIYAPLFNDCLMWINGMNMPSGNGVLVQLMRNYFGRHPITLENGDSVEIEWDE